MHSFSDQELIDILGKPVKGVIKKFAYSPIPKLDIDIIFNPPDVNNSLCKKYECYAAVTMGYLTWKVLSNYELNIYLNRGFIIV